MSDNKHPKSDDLLSENAPAEKQAPQIQNYQVLARKYRPDNFDDLIGQHAMVQTLTNAFESGRIAHAFMLTGVRGVGKTTTARVLARALNYQSENVSTPTTMLDSAGVHCRAIMEGAHVDVIEMDAASYTSIDDIREITKNVLYMPASARYKIYIIDEVHMLSTSAFNGLLKTLEEPPPHVKFIFATTEIRRVPVTVLSRCQRFDLRRLTHDDTLQLLNKICVAENVALPEEALSLIARAADGSARDALSLLDRALAHNKSGETSTDGEGQAGSESMSADTMRRLLGLADRARIFDLFDKLMANQLSDALAEFDEQYKWGADPIMILADLAELTHWLTRLKFVPSAGDDVTFSQEMRVRGKQVADQLSVRHLARLWQLLLNGHGEAQRAMNSRAATEMVLIRLAHLADSPTPEELIKQWEQAESKTTADAAPTGASNTPMPTPVAQKPMQQNSGQTALKTQTQTQAQAQPEENPQPEEEAQGETMPPPLLQDFVAVIALAEQHRDIALKHKLENDVHLIKFESAYGASAGRVEIKLTESADVKLPQELMQKLQLWTGQKWMVTVSQQGGAPTIAQSRQSMHNDKREAALNDAFVKQALAHFPDAEIVSIRDFDDTAPATNAADAPAEQDD